MKIGLIDVDGHNFPNIPLMKLSAWHKQQGDSVEWYDPLFSGHMDKVYMSKVFGFTPDYEFTVDADEVIKGGSGYCIELVDGKEIYHKENDRELQSEIEHIYPDYSIYPELTKDTAYGFLTRGCPRGCSFCHVQHKEGGGITQSIRPIRVLVRAEEHNTMRSEHPCLPEPHGTVTTACRQQSEDQFQSGVGHQIGKQPQPGIDKANSS